jgi:hypothetical protein
MSQQSSIRSVLGRRQIVAAVMAIALVLMLALTVTGGPDEHTENPNGAADVAAQNRALIDGRYSADAIVDQNLDRVMNESHQRALQSSDWSSSPTW